MTAQFNLETPPPGHRYNLNVSTEKDETTGERRLRLYKDFVLFTITVILLSAVAVFCITTIYSDHSDAESKKWAMSIISATIGGLVGYLVKK